jgi:hypothetical protein
MLFKSLDKLLPDTFEKLFIASNFKFPIQVQNCLKVKFYSIRHGQKEYTIKSIRAEDISNASYTAKKLTKFYESRL